MTQIAVSILSSNNLDTIKQLNNTDVDYIHIDVMDGLFVKEKHYSIDEINNIIQNTNKLLDIHLMVNDPYIYINQLNIPNIGYLTIHYEVLNDLSIIDTIKSKGIKCGVSVNPNTNIEDIFYLLNKIDLVLIMSVEPGYGGQSFIEDTFIKIKKLKNEIDNRQLKIKIAVDGGINNNNAKKCIEMGTDILISGTYILNSNDWQQTINGLR